MQATYKNEIILCRKDTENINPRVSNTSNGSKTIFSRCAICGSKKFIKDQKANGLLSNLGVKTPLSKVPILGDILLLNEHAKLYIKMNEIVNKFLLAGDKFMPEMHLKQPGLLTVLVDHLLKTKKEFRNLKKQETRAIFTKMNLIRLAFNMIWLMEILKI